MNIQNEQRLFVIRNWDASDKIPVGRAVQRYEFEVFAEVPLNAAVNIGPYSLVPWDLQPMSGGVSRSLVFRLADCLQDGGSLEKPTKSGFYHGVTMPSEFCAILTALMRRRFRLGPILRIDDSPVRLLPPGQQRHRGLISGEISSALLVDRMGKVRRLSSEYHESFLLACRLYQEAISIIDEKPDLSYLLLVSCIEIFVAKHSRRTTENDLSEDVRRALAGVADDEARRILLKRILELDRGISRNFAEFILSNVRGGFWEESPAITPEQGRVTETELPVLLKRIYNQRSKTSHEAAPFPPNVLSPPDDLSEIDRRTELVVGQKRWTQPEFVPYVRFFERLVQHVLLTFLDCHSSDNELTPATPSEG